MFRAADNVQLLLGGKVHEKGGKTGNADHQVPVFIRFLHCFFQRLARNNIKLDVIYSRLLDRPQEGHDIINVAFGGNQLRTQSDV